MNSRPIRFNGGRSSVGTLIGFLIPFAFAALVGIAFHIHTVTTQRNPKVTSAIPTTQGAASPPGALPSASDVAAANAAILAYCSTDLRQDNSCSLVAGSNVTAPGFVEVGVSEGGHFETGDSVSQGQALAKGTGSSWSVIWLGQGCVPKDVAAQNNVPATFTICTS